MAVIGSVSVRVVPSFSGMNRRVEKQFAGAGASAGKQFSRSMGASVNLQSVGAKLRNVGGQISSVSRSAREVGGSLTRNVTAPAGIAAAAIGGIPAALGFGRLVAIDSAQAKLKGLGYSAKEVESISGQVEDAIVGTMVTMDEATNIAAGALGAGVSEGDDLKEYIRLVGDAAATANRPVGEMAQIFNRVQGQGQLMLGELNMIEDAVPGTTARLAESYNVGQTEFRKMVSAGEVDAARFRTVMDDFIGGSGEAVAGSFMGMVKNVKAFVAILGQEIMGGVFQSVKQELSGFIEFLQTDAAESWAKRAGAAVSDAFTRIIRAVKGAISWWNSLSEATQGFILKAIGIAAALGPALIVLGSLAGAVGSIVSVIGMITGAVGRFLALPFVQNISRLVARFGGLRVAMALIGRVIGVLTGPIGWIITALVTMWTSSEKFRGAVVNLGKALWDSLVKIWEALQPAFSGMGSAMSWIGDLISWVGRVLGDVLAWTINNLVIPAVNWLADAIVWVIDWMKGLGDTSTTQGGFIAKAWAWIKNAAKVVVDWFMNTALPWMKRVWSGISSGAQWMWRNVLSPVFRALKAGWDLAMRGIQWAWRNILKPAWDAVVRVALWLWNNVLKPTFGFIRKAWGAMVTGIRWYWRNVLSPVINLVGDIIKWLWHNVAKPLFARVRDAWASMVDRIKWVWANVLKPVIDLVGAIIMWLWRNVAKPYFKLLWTGFQTMGRWLKRVWDNVIKPMIDRFGAWVKRLYRNYVRPALDWIRDKWSWLSGKLSDFWNDRLKPILKAFGDFVKNDVVDRVKSGIDMIDKAWRTVANIFRKPINWVINTVWNGGIKKAFDAVADAVNSDATLGKIPNIPRFAVGGAVRGPGTGTSDDILAKLSNGEHVLTAKEVKALGGHEKVVELRKRITAGEDITKPESQQLAGARPSDAMLPMGGLWETVKAAGSKALSWGRGLLADTAEKLMSPILDGVSSFVSDFGLMGQLGSDLIDWGWDSVLDWIRGEDKKAMAAGSPGTGAGLFDGPTGAWRRPSNGPMTSWYGPRWGAFHSGVDIAGGGPTYAAYNGAVQRVGWNILPGRTGVGILLSHGGGLQSYYGHNPVGGPQVSPGQKVKAGQHIGYQGATGNVTGTHLHWELLRNGQAQNVNSMFRDKGGLLYPGMNMVENATGKNEFIFNQRQFDNLNRMAESASGGGVHITQHNHHRTDDYGSAQDLRFTMRQVARQPRKAGV